MEGYNNKEEKPEDQKSAKSAINHSKEQERFHTEWNYIYLLYDFSSSLSSNDYSETSDSGTREKPTKPMSPSNKSSTFQAKCRSDNGETPLKQPHHDAFTSKQDL